MKADNLVVITGASEGIGFALAKKFSQEKFPMLLISRNIKKNAKVNKLIDKNKNIIIENVDVTDGKKLKQVIKKSEKKYGKTSLLVNNAGLINIGEFSQIPEKKLTQEIDVLFNGVINGIQAVLSDMSKRKKGTIINISSIADRKPYPTAVTYHACKHAVRSIGESLQQAQAKNMVRVINIAPGLIKTNIHKNMGITFEQYSENLGNPTFIDSDEIAEIIYYIFMLPQHICIRDIVIMPTDCDF